VPQVILDPLVEPVQRVRQEPWDLKDLRAVRELLVILDLQALWEDQALLDLKEPKGELVVPV
jgi:hypothetical protein